MSSVNNTDQSASSQSADLFQALGCVDKNGDGVIEERKGNKKKSEGDEKYIPNIDLDRDGYITQTEAKVHLLTHHDVPRPASLSSDYLTTFDKLREQELVVLLATLLSGDVLVKKEILCVLEKLVNSPMSERLKFSMASPLLGVITDENDDVKKSAIFLLIDLHFSCGVPLDQQMVEPCLEYLPQTEQYHEKLKLGMALSDLGRANPSDVLHARIVSCLVATFGGQQWLTRFGGQEDLLFALNHPHIDSQVKTAIVAGLAGTLQTDDSSVREDTYRLLLSLANSDASVEVKMAMGQLIDPIILTFSKLLDCDLEIFPPTGALEALCKANIPAELQTLILNKLLMALGNDDRNIQICSKHVIIALVCQSTIPDLPEKCVQILLGGLSDPNVVVRRNVLGLLTGLISLSFTSYPFYGWSVMGVGQDNEDMSCYEREDDAIVMSSGAGGLLGWTDFALASAEHLWREGYKKNVKSVIAALSAEEPSIRAASAIVLGFCSRRAFCNQTRKKIVKELFETLYDDNTDVRSAARTALSQYGYDSNTLPPHDYTVPQHSLIGTMVEPLKVALKDGDMEVRKQAAAALLAISK